MQVEQIAGARDPILLEDEFESTDVSKDPKYLRVGRVMLKNKKLSMETDVNFDLFPMEKGMKYKVILTQSFLPEYKQEFNYAMYGKIIKIDLEAGEYQSIYLSFGGLVMQIRGKFEDMCATIKTETRCYFFIRKI